MATVALRKRQVIQQKHAVKIYPLGESSFVVQQLVKRGQDYVEEKGKQKVISFKKFPGDQELLDAVREGLKGGLKKSPYQVSKDERTAIKRSIGPLLSELRFEGSFPHFRRKRGRQIELISFVFMKDAGAGFYIWIGKSVPLSMLTAMQPPANDRLSHNVEYEGRDPNHVIEDVTEFIHNKASVWWANR